MSAPSTPAAADSAKNVNNAPRDNTHTQTPNSNNNRPAFSSLFGSLHRSISRIFHAAPNEDETAPRVSNDEISPSESRQRRVNFESAPTIDFLSNGARDEQRLVAATPVPASRRSQPRTEPRPRRSLFATTPRTYNAHRPSASARKSKTPAQLRQENRIIKQNLWKAGWEGVPLNRITDPRSLQRREDEAKEAGINLADFDIYDPGFGPNQRKTQQDTIPEEDAAPGQKRKRPALSPSNSIPNPPGASFGLDYRYFEDSDEGTEDEDLPHPPKSVLKKATETSFERIQRSTKRVKFDNSPTDTPSKERARAKYAGIHFADSPNAFITADENSSSPTPQSNSEPDFVPSSAHPTPNRFCLPDNWSDESSLASTKSRDSSNMSGVEYEQARDESTFLPDRESSTFMHIPPQETPLPETPKKSGTDVDLSPLSKARQSAERYKPKSPSTLRQSTQLPSSSPLAEKKGEEEDNEFDRLDWPKVPSMVEAGYCSQDIADLVEALWTPEDDIRADEWFEKEFARFKAAELAA